ncbi:MAG: pyroglutamyl-peptidase I family protein [Candidatus Hodarchaeales archaeon]
MKNLLVTGFEPYNGYTINPSAELMRVLQGKKIGSYKLFSHVLPLDYTKTLGLMRKHISECDPSIILCFGQSDRPTISLERVALNSIGLHHTDNYGHSPSSDIIREGAPAAYFSNIDLHPLAESIRKADIPANVSYHAGLFACNWIFFHVMDWIYTSIIDSKSVFVHIPPLPAQAIEKKKTDLPTMTLEKITDAVKIIIENL